jgi:hypothetical protein
MNRRLPSALRLPGGALVAALALGACSSGNEPPPYDPLATSSSSGGTSSGGSSTGGGGTLPEQPSSFFEGTYDASKVDYAWISNQAITSTVDLAAKYDWAHVESNAAPGSLVANMLATLEGEFCVGEAAKKHAPSVILAQGLSIGKAAGGDAAKNDLALQYVEKSLLVAAELYAFRELRESLTRSKPEDSALDVDAAAILLGTLESRMIKRSDAEVPGLWSEGSTKITNDKLAARAGELLFIARGKLAAGDADATAAVHRAGVYASKYFYASVLNYLAQVEKAVAMQGDPAVQQAEGGTFSEGLSTAFFGSDDASAAPMRALWGGPASGITVASGKPVTLGVYATLARHAVATIDNPDQGEQLRAAGQLAGVIDVLDEPLAASGADVSALQTKAQGVVTKLVAGDVATAKADAAALEQVIDGVAK